MHHPNRKIFVYGTLSQGMTHHEKLLEGACFLGEASVRGALYRLESGYHVLLSGDQSISGEVYEISSGEILIALMDEFHGYSPAHFEKSLYHRLEVEILVAGQIERVWCYFLNPSKLPKTAQLVETGSWREDALKNPPITQKLTDAQKEYVLKIGQSTGREIVPIQLEIYRELMNLGLIVDKGRRLALSKMGQEVLRYLE